MDADRDSVANPSYAGSESGNSDYAYPIKQWLLRAETVFDEVAFEDLQENGSSQSEPNTVSDREDEDMYEPGIPETSTNTNDESLNKNTNFHFHLPRVEENEHFITDSVNKNRTRLEGFREETTFSSCTLSQDFKQADDWVDFFWKAGLSPYLCVKYSETMLREGVDESSQKQLTAYKLCALGLAKTDADKVMNSLAQKSGSLSVDKVVENNIADLPRLSSKSAGFSETTSTGEAQQSAGSDAHSPVRFKVVSIHSFFDSISPPLEDGWPYLNFEVGERFDVMRGTIQQGKLGPMWLVKKEKKPWMIGWVRSANVKELSRTEGGENQPSSNALVTETFTAVPQPSSPGFPDGKTRTLPTHTSALPTATNTNIRDKQQAAGDKEPQSKAANSSVEVKKLERRLEQRNKGERTARKQVSTITSTLQNKTIQRAPGKLAQASVNTPGVQVEKSVTKLLLATKQLLKTLTDWCKQAATEQEVSDDFVRLGFQFNLACRAFNALGIETADLGDVPGLLRPLLEDTVNQPASSAALEKNLPQIRDIIVNNLLSGLKRKQMMLRKQLKDKQTTRETSSNRTLSTPADDGSLLQASPPTSERLESGEGNDKSKTDIREELQKLSI